jgi:hypothetical protein
MASQKVEALIPCNQDTWFYLEQDPINRLVARMDDVTVNVDKTAREMGNLFHKLIQSTESKDFSQLSDTITMVTHMEAVDKTADKMGDLFRKFIQSAKYQDTESKDFSQLSDTITMVQEQLEKLKILLDTTESEDFLQLSDIITIVQEQLETLKIQLCCAQILLNTPEA